MLIKPLYLAVNDSRESGEQHSFELNQVLDMMDKKTCESLSCLYCLFIHFQTMQ